MSTLGGPDLLKCDWDIGSIEYNIVVYPNPSYEGAIQK